MKPFLLILLTLGLLNLGCFLLAGRLLGLLPLSLGLLLIKKIIDGEKGQA